MKREEDEENLFKKNYNPEENEKNKLHLQTGKNIAFSGRPSHQLLRQVHADIFLLLVLIMPDFLSMLPIFNMEK